MGKQTGLVKATCALAALMVFWFSLNLFYSGSHHVSSFLPKILPQPQSNSQSIQNDAMKISMGTYSKVYVERRTYSLGEEIKVQIILHNNRGERKRRGGGHLRLWMENMKVKAAVSGKVMDNNDGTYSGRVRAMWSGEADIRVMILGRREEIALMYELFNKTHSLWYIYGGFRNGSESEDSECSVTPYDVKQKWCNFTAENAGFPWFCIHPKKSSLSCDNWYNARSKHQGRNFSVLKKWTRSDEVDLLQNRTLKISGTPYRVGSPVTSCNKVRPEVTWNRHSPQGFFYEDQWHSTKCTDTLNHTQTVYKECLRGRTLYLHGDSTSLQFMNNLNEMFSLKPKGQGHNPRVTSDPEYNFTLSWYVHEFPFYNGGPYNNSVHLAQHVLLDSIKSNSRDIVILYLYVHFTLNHPDVFKQHVQRLVQSARDLISRAPGVTIAVRGPHAFMEADIYPLLQCRWGLQYMDILHKEFESLKKNVLFLDYWDLTMARLPVELHASEKTVAVMVRYMMAIICYRNHH